MGSKHDFFPAMAILISILGIIYLSIQLKRKMAGLRTKKQYSVKWIVLNLIQYVGGMVILTTSMLFGGVFLSLHFFGIKEPTQTTEIAQVQIGQIVNALNMYYNDCGKYPASLNNLVTADPTCPKWGPEPYRKAKYIIDPWGREYIYTLFEDHVEIKTLGKDGNEGGTGKDTDVIEKMNL